MSIAKSHAQTKVPSSLFKLYGSTWLALRINLKTSHLVVPILAPRTASLSDAKFSVVTSKMAMRMSYFPAF